MSLLTDALLGLYIGVLTGIIPALIAWVLGFVFKYFTGVTLPGFGVVVLGVAIAGVQGGLLGLTDPAIAASPVTLVALLVVMMLVLYAHSKGDAMGAAFPRRVTLRGLRDRTLSADVVERIGGFGQARIAVEAPVEDVEGYPPLPEELRAQIRGAEWTFPADLSIGELERRIGERLVNDHDLAEVVVDVDPDGTARVAAAPPIAGVSRRLERGERAVSVDVLVPSGMARGDSVTLTLTDAGAADAEGRDAADATDAGGDSAADAEGSDGTGAGDGPAPAVRTVEGRVVSARTYRDDEDDGAVTERYGAPTTDGGDGRVTIAVDAERVADVLAAEGGRLAVAARGGRPEQDLIAVLKRQGQRFHRTTLSADSSLAGTSLGEAAVGERHGVAVVALRGAEGWRVAPDDDAVLEPGAEIFVVGDRAAIERFEEVAS